MARTLLEDDSERDGARVEQDDRDDKPVLGGLTRDPAKDLDKRRHARHRDWRRDEIVAQKIPTVPDDFPLLVNPKTTLPFLKIGGNGGVHVCTDHRNGASDTDPNLCGRCVHAVLDAGPELRKHMTYCNILRRLGKQGLKKIEARKPHALGAVFCQNITDVAEARQKTAEHLRWQPNNVHLFGVDDDGFAIDGDPFNNLY